MNNFIFADLYKGDRFYSEMRGLGLAYNPPERFEHGKEELVARLKGEGDGQDVEIYELRLPATFFTIKVLPTPNSVGEMQAGYEITTGSGMAKLVCELAKAISIGMIKFHGKEVMVMDNAIEVRESKAQQMCAAFDHLRDEVRHLHDLLGMLKGEPLTGNEQLNTSETSIMSILNDFPSMLHKIANEIADIRKELQEGLL